MGKKENRAAQIFLNWFVYLDYIKLDLLIFLTMKIVSLKFRTFFSKFCVGPEENQ